MSMALQNLVHSNPSVEGERMASEALFWLARTPTGKTAINIAGIHHILVSFIAEHEFVYPGSGPLPLILKSAMSTGFPVTISTSVHCEEPIQIHGEGMPITLRGRRSADGTVPMLWRCAPQGCIVVHSGQLLLQDLHLQNDYSTAGVDAEALHVSGMTANVFCQRVRFSSHSDCGICVSNGQLVLADCQIAHCGGTGITAFGGDLHLKRTSIECNRRYGVYAHSSIVHFLGGNHLVANGRSGLFLSTDAHGELLGKNFLGQNGYPQALVLEDCTLKGWADCFGGCQERHHRKRKRRYQPVRVPRTTAQW